MLWMRDFMFHLFLYRWRLGLQLKSRLYGEQVNKEDCSGDNPEGDKYPDQGTRTGVLLLY